MVQMGNYRTAEGETIDLTQPETQSFMKANYPAIMTNRPIGMSDNYQFMPSHTIALNMQERFGMGLVEVGQQFSRARNPAGQEHFMKFRLPSGLAKLEQVGDSAPELVIMNSHNGRSTIRAYAGIFRLVCSNGMVVSEKSFGQIKLRHFGEANSFEEFGKVLDVMARRMAILDGRMGKMKAQMLTPHEQNQLAKSVMAMRGTPDWVEAADVLQVRRPEDVNNEDGTSNLWVTFNRIQENLTSQPVSRTFEDRRARSLRPLTGARAHILTNEKIWIGLENFISNHFPGLAAETFDIIDGTYSEAVKEDQPGGVEAVAPRSFEELIKLGSFAEVEAITETELALLGKDLRTKLAKRKSYLKGKEAVSA